MTDIGASGFSTTANAPIDSGSSLLSVSVDVVVELIVEVLEEVELEVVVELVVEVLEDVVLDVVVELTVDELEDGELDVVVELAVDILEDIELDVVIELTGVVLETAELADDEDSGFLVSSSSLLLIRSSPVFSKPTSSISIALSV